MVQANRCKGEPSCNRTRVARQSKLTLVGLTSAREWSVIFTCWGSHHDVYQHLNAVNNGKEPIACILQVKGYATRERFLQRIRQNPPNLRKILSRDGVFNEIVIARHAQLNRFSR